MFLMRNSKEKTGFCLMFVFMALALAGKLGCAQYVQDAQNAEESGRLALLIFHVRHDEDKGYGGVNCPVLRLPGVVDVQDTLDPFGSLGAFRMRREERDIRLLHVLTEEGDEGRIREHFDSRVEPGSYPPGAPTDPDVPN